MKIRILATGGTFDKEYDEIKEKLLFRETHIPEMLKRGRNLVDTTLRTTMLIDSLEMTESDRKVILHACEKSPEKRILIIHGTSTMDITAKYLAKKIKNKTIVITGAMEPYAFGSSDGLFNLGSALAFAQAPHTEYMLQ